LAVFGEPADATVLGALTLEELGLEVDPRERVLRPTVAWLLLADDREEPDRVSVSVP